MPRGVGMTAAQKQICLDNADMFPALICKLPGMEGTTSRQIADFLRKQRQPSEELQLAEMLENYIQTHGLPREYGSVLKYIPYLKSRA